MLLGRECDAGLDPHITHPTLHNIIAFILIIKGSVLSTDPFCFWMTMSDHQLCPKCRAALLERATVSTDTAEQAVARMRRFLAGNGEAQPAASKLSVGVKIDLMLPDQQAAVVAKAIRATGIRHQGEALVAICNAYLGSG